VYVLAHEADIGYDLLVKTNDIAINRTCIDVKASLPETARGSFYISGPAKFEMGGYSFNSYFDGYGKINRFELHKDQVCWTAKMLNSSYMKNAEQLGRISNGPSFMGTTPKLPHCPLRHPLCMVSMYDNNWVNIMPTADPHQGLMITDSPIMVRLNLDNLTVQSGPYPFEDGKKPMYQPAFLEKFHVGFGGSAHPTILPRSPKTYIEVMPEMALPVIGGGQQAVLVYSIDTTTMKRSLIANVPTKGHKYLHSFGVSENYVVLPMNLDMKMPSMEGNLVDAFSGGWEGIEVVDLKGQRQTFQTDPFYHVHIANTFENETGIVMDMGTYQDIPFAPRVLSTAMFLNKTSRDTKYYGVNVERIHLHLMGEKKGQVTRQMLSPPGRQTDFFKINNERSGLPHCIYYAVEWFHNDKEFASMAILKHDVCQNKRSYWTKENQYPGEPFFIGKGTEQQTEDHGLLVFVVLDGPRGASNFVVLDARTFDEVAVVELSTYIPFTAHGQFIPEEAQQIIKEVMSKDTPDVAAAVESAVIV